MTKDNVRTFDNGKITVQFRDEQTAADFDAYLDSTFTISIGGETVGSFKVKESFDPYKFFGVDKQEEE